MRREGDGGKTAILPDQGDVSGAAGQPARGEEKVTDDRRTDDGATCDWTEWLTPELGATLGGVAVRAAVRSAHQCIEIGVHPRLGHLYRLDGRVMSTEADAFIQHEIMVHPMAVAHGSPTRALVLGGGDGGSARELLRVPGMREIVIAELDPQVVALARQWLTGIHGGALDDAAVRWRIGDAMATMAALRAAGERFDLIVFDLTEADDGGPAMPLFEPGGLALARDCLAQGGLLSLHLGPPFHRPATARALHARLRSLFRWVRPMTVSIPAYGALWAIAIASDHVDPRALDPDTVATRLRDWRLDSVLRCYHAGLHTALFALPRYLQTLFDEGDPAA